AWRERKITSLKAGQGLPGDEVTALFEDHAARLWVGIDHDLTLFDGRKFTRIRQANGQPIGFVQQLTEDADGDVWVVTSDNETLWRLHQGRVMEAIPRATVPFTYGAIVADPHEGIWLPLKNGNLGKYRAGELETIQFDRAPGMGQIVGLIAQADGSIVG